MNPALTEVSPWLAGGVALLLIASGVLAVIGSIGLLRLPGFYARMHAPTLGATLGLIFAIAASILLSLGSGTRAVWHELLLVFFVALSAPVTAMLLMRAVRFQRSRPATPAPTKKKGAARKR